MATKTISLTEDAYLRLASLKRGNESFSDVIQRLTGREDVMRFAGCVPTAFASELRDASAAFRARFEHEARARSL